MHVGQLVLRAFEIITGHLVYLSSKSNKKRVTCFPNDNMDDIDTIFPG